MDTISYLHDGAELFGNQFLEALSIEVFFPPGRAEKCGHHCLNGTLHI